MLFCTLHEIYRLVLGTCNSFEKSQTIGDFIGRSRKAVLLRIELKNVQRKYVCKIVHSLDIRL